MRILWLMLIAVALPAHAARRSYDVEYVAEFVPAEKAARITIAITPGDGRATRLNFDMPAARYTDISADGSFTREGDRVIWIPPEAGGRIRYTHPIDSKRVNGSYDAHITADWAIVRGDNLFPPALVKTTKESDSRSRLRFKLPPGWGNVDTPYVLTRDRKEYVIVNPGRRFDRPVGWIIAGDVGTRREWIDGVEISIASPKGENMRRMDALALINVAFFELQHAFKTMPPKILIVGAGDPMWRGGLSGPRSMWLHAERPLISENATSTLFHELTHVITRIRGAPGDDWITEGLAEFYSLEIMRRVGLITEKRYGKAVAFARRWSSGVKSLRTSASSGARTARAVLLLIELDEEIKRRTDDRRDIDELTQKLMEIGRVSITDLREVTRKITGAESEVLASPLLK